MKTLQLLMTVVAAVLTSSATNKCLPYVELATTTTYSYQFLHQQGVDVTRGSTSFRFQVCAANDAHVALLQDDGVTNRNIYEIVIGGWGNTQSVIRTGRQHANRVRARKRPLSATQFRDFWISWDNGVISVGTGTVVGAGRFMSWRDPSPHNVRYIAVSTGWGATGLWRFVPASEASLTTSTDYKYRSLHSLGVDVAPGDTSFKFRVRARSNVHVALQQEDGFTYWNTYEIVIGGWRNTQSVIRTGRQQANRVTARHRPLSATQFRDFWISWANGVISVGTGTVVGARRFMSWRDPSPHNVRFVAVSTGCGATGLWRFERKLPLVCLETGDDYHYHSLADLGVHLNGQATFIFWVKATNDAHIALLSNREDYNHNLFEIVIGGWRNTQSVIRDRKQGPNLARARHSPLSGSKHLPFWISFSGGTIAVGTGTEVGRRTFLSCTDRSFTQIKYLSVAAGWKSKGKWLFSSVEPQGGAFTGWKYKPGFKGWQQLMINAFNT